MTVRAVRGLLADLQKKIGDDTGLLTHHLTYTDKKVYTATPGSDVQYPLPTWE